MSIRFVAKELYRLEQEVSDLEERLQSASPRDRDETKANLMLLRSKRDRLRGILAAKKEPPPYRRPREKPYARQTT